MPRTKLISPRRPFTVRLPEDLATRAYSDLFSEAEGCVPYGAWSKFVEECIREHYARVEGIRPLGAIKCDSAKRWVCDEKADTGACSCGS